MKDKSVDLMAQSAFLPPKQHVCCRCSRDSVECCGVIGAVLQLLHSRRPPHCPDELQVAFLWTPKCQQDFDNLKAF